MNLLLLLTVADGQRLLADRLRMARKRQNLTQAELASRARVGTATIQRLESDGSGQITTLLRVLSALGHLRDLDALLVAPQPQTMDELRKRHGSA